MEKFEKGKNNNNLNMNLCKIVLDYLPTQNKFLIIQNFKQNEKLLNSLISIFLHETNQNDTSNKFKYSKITKTTHNKEVGMKKIDKEIQDISNKTEKIEFISPKFIFAEQSEFISKEAFGLINEINKKLIRKQNKIDYIPTNLKYYPVYLSSKHFDQCFTNLANKNSALFSWKPNSYTQYWSSYPSLKEKEEYVILKIHPCLSFVTRILLNFYVYSWTLYNCKFIQISFGFKEDEFYFSTGKIPVDVNDKKIEISFNTAFLANYVKVEFFDKLSKQFNSEDNYYVCMENLKIKGHSMKDFSEHKKFLFPKFFEMQPAPADKWETYIENLIFLDKEKFKQTEIYRDKLKEFENNFALISNKFEKKWIYFFFKNHKFLKIHETHDFIMDHILKDHSFNLINNSIQPNLVDTDSYSLSIHPKFKCFRGKKE